ncbi:AsmA family protein [Sulfitobacter pacificus]|uniref:AsmA family protein n=1 Tax=Sulfitobacter pacificus TaxID=1499314 RepID=UPI003608F1AE
MKWIIRGLGVLLLIAVIAVVGVLMLPADRIARIASDQLTRLTGRSVTISGDVSMTFWPVLGVSAGGLEVGNADWAKEGAMFSTAQAAIGVDASALLRGEIRITNVEATSPTIRLQSRKDGRANWVFTDADGAAQIETENAPSKPATPLTIERLVIRDAALIYDAEGADLVSYAGVDLTLDWPVQDGPAEITAALRPAGQVVELAATIDQFSGFLDGQVQPVNVAVNTSGGGLTLKGRASLAGAVAGALDLKTSDTGALLAALGAGGRPAQRPGAKHAYPC